jgi:hypothetical protein
LNPDQYAKTEGDCHFIMNLHQHSCFTHLIPLKLCLKNTDIKRKTQEDVMKKIISVFALFLIVAGCSMIPQLSAPEPAPSNLNVIQTWTGYATGHGGDCSDADVDVQVLEDYSITGYANATNFNVIIKLRGQLSPDGVLHATGIGTGGVNVTYEGTVKGNSASGTWKSDYYSCYGTWELAKK